MILLKKYVVKNKLKENIIWHIGWK